PPPPRFPNFVDVLLMGILFAFGWLASAAAAATALSSHLFGVHTEKQAMNDIHYALGSQGVWYLVSLALWMLVFPRIWHTGFFAGIEWRARAALRLRWQLFSAAFACFILAIIDGVLIPGPKEAPIDQVFRMPGGAWFLFAFGITLAPLIEEMIYRGFLLPALCTLWDWTAEHLQNRPAPWPDANGKVKWSVPAMVFGSIAASIPFALMHGQQTSYSIGTFVLLFFVSAALCWIRLSTRSLAASTVVHACYNLLLFVLMIWGTGGFKHLDNM
ncbi:MAG TPA: CPBP family intramembrane glutamic endopeptidase, partial [Terracidiphilus sp.]